MDEVEFDGKPIFTLASMSGDMEVFKFSSSIFEVGWMFGLSGSFEMIISIGAVLAIILFVVNATSFTFSKTVELGCICFSELNFSAGIL